MAQNNPRTIYLGIVDILKKMIENREINEKMPSVTQLAEIFVVSRSTVERALRTLKDEGVLTPRQGSGWYVTARGDHRPALARLRDHVRTVAPGEMLASEPELAPSLGISRTALRPAIAVLLAEGVLTRGRGRRLVATGKKSRTEREKT